MYARSEGDATTRARAPASGSVAIKVLVGIAILGVLVALMLPANRGARGSARRAQCKNNLKQIAIALLNYQSQHDALPPAYTVDEAGKPLHSWRTLILPYLEESLLYKRIDLTKPWDDPANAEPFKTIVHVYFCPESTTEPHLTTYLAVVASNSSVTTTPRPLSEITDKHAETITLVEFDSERAVPWMAPTDADEASFLALGPERKHHHIGGMHAASVDGSVRFLPSNIEPRTRRALISIDGKESLEF